MINQTSAVRGISLLIGLLALSLIGCRSRSTPATPAAAASSATPANGAHAGAGTLDGVYHAPGNGPMTLTIKGGKANMTVGTETQTMDYKVEGNQLTLLNPKEGNVVFTINDDGTLNSELGSLQKNPK
jgi:hypothetical protein